MLVSGFQNYTSLGRILDMVERLTGNRVRKETVEVRDSYGRVAAEDVASPSNVPDRARSHVDGYAVVASDLRGASPRSPIGLRLKPPKAVRGGRDSRISSGEAMGVVTGGLLPSGADAVVPVEETTRIGRMVIFTTKSRRGDFCFAAGSDVRRGDVVIERGRAIRAQDIGLLTVIGVATVVVVARPRVALIATGSELTVASKVDDPSMIRESHIPILENLIRENGGEPVVVGIVPDDIGRIASAVELALEESDLVLTLGGTSLGERDLVERALRRVAQGTKIVHGIRIDRGRVAGVAEVRGKLVVMLPGPVQAAMNAFVLLALPSISRLAGKRKATAPTLVARLEADWEARKKFPHFTKVVYVHLEMRKSEFVAYPVVRETESMSILKESNGYVVIPEHTVKLRAGAKVAVRLLPGFSYVKGRFLDEG
jgi:molybdenum cofactor synthesis domain-containing protein